ncbi:hypothetical protein BDB00DRAFT_369323 [Zychaea mexicana]|uniref:uncharacterized protein n=1 Tax=Zychaea mexicana TaxID=64656 RepID=UPI0022FDC1FC|nr:uncharacterized protein BDB00DRAFT_369323 [Zychaea mexicana]KAI9493607.1 hypothetical protein BDB00DRAFT_369323 [Zychaea mexicana]
MMISVDGLVHVFDIFDPSKQTATFTLPACNMPCLEYDGSLSIVLAPFAARRIHHFKWDPVPSSTAVDPNSNGSSDSGDSPSSSPTNEQHPHQQLPPQPPKTLTSSISSLLSRPKRQRTYIDTAGRKAARSLRRYSSYNEYGYACQARTAHYIKQVQEKERHNNSNNGDNDTNNTLGEPNFRSRLRLISSIRTSPLGWTTRQVVNIAVHNDRVAIANRHGDIALFALNGTTAAHVTFKNGKRQWIEEDAAQFRDEDDLSDGYDFIRGRLAMGSMGIIYGGRDGSLWWLDFSCRPEDPSSSR